MLSKLPVSEQHATFREQDRRRRSAGWLVARTLRLFLVFLMFSPFSSAVWQEAPVAPASFEGQRVSRIEIAGRPDLDLRPLQSLISQPVNAPYSQEKVDATAAALRNTRRFQAVDVQVTPEAAGLRLMFVLQPALYFGIFDFFRATKAFTYTRLLQVAAFPKQEPYTEGRVAQAQSNLIDFFHQNGYFLATVETSIQPDQRRGLVNVLFHVNLKQRARVGQVILTGITGEKADRLVKSLRSLRARLRGARLKPGRPYSLGELQKATTFLQNQLAKDRYLSAQVKLVSSEYDPQTNRANITFDITQGPEISVEVSGARMSGRARRKQIPIYQENAVDQDLVQEGEQNLASYFQNKGFFDVAVRSSMEQRASGITIVYQIERGERGRVKDVGFQGNRRFSDRDLRPRVAVKQARWLRFFSRGKFSTQLVTRSVTSLESLYRNAGYREVKIAPPGFGT